MPNLKEIIHEDIAALFAVEDLGDYTRVRGPCTYPDGDTIEFYIKETASGIEISDLCETVSWIRRNTAPETLSDEQITLINEICEETRIKFERGMLFALCDSTEGIADALTRVAQAAVRIADLYRLSLPE